MDAATAELAQSATVPTSQAVQTNYMVGLILSKCFKARQGEDGGLSVRRNGPSFHQVAQQSPVYQNPIILRKPNNHSQSVQ